ncbi:MAG: hypothetical protein EOO06_07640 [Chitinophagaceae bacterium]|nr:MAG: hypothetical protein EOO06_07640 [Chitinophagaceae bacterium]
MPTYNVIHQVTEKHFELKQFIANSADEYQQEKSKIGITYDDIHSGGWRKKDYPAGDFIVHWRTNYGYGKQSYAYAYILYLNKNKDTRTFIKCYENVQSLKEVAELMNKYAKITNDDIRELFENVVDRLGMYHNQFEHNTSYDFMLEVGYDNNSSEQLYHLDYDSVCLRELQKSMETAVKLQVSCETLYRLSTHLDQSENQVVENIKTRLAGLYEKYRIGVTNLVWRGRYGSKHIIGNFDYLANAPKIPS